MLASDRERESLFRTAARGATALVASYHRMYAVMECRSDIPRLASVSQALFAT